MLPYCKDEIGLELEQGNGISVCKGLVLGYYCLNYFSDLSVALYFDLCGVFVYPLILSYVLPIESY